MIYISSSSLKNDHIFETLENFKKNKIFNIELSGGCKYSENLDQKIVDYKKRESNLNLRIHNYFPPPKKDFIINIGSLNEDIYKKSLKHCLGAIQLSKQIGSNEYSIHAGFLVDPKKNEIGLGNSIKTKHKFFNKKDSIQRMINAHEILKKEAGKEVKLYLENNVISKKNLSMFENNPLLLTNKESFEELKKNFNFNLLLDLAHLKVSCNTLNLNFEEEANYLINQTDYIHLSGNDGIEDSNDSLVEDDLMSNFLKNTNLKNKKITLEVYRDIPVILKDLKFLESII